MYGKEGGWLPFQGRQIYQGHALVVWGTKFFLPRLTTFKCERDVEENKQKVTKVASLRKMEENPPKTLIPFHGCGIYIYRASTLFYDRSCAVDEFNIDGV